jgi:hypothetical protein
MIGTIEIRKVVTIELDRSEVMNILNGSTINGRIQVRQDNSYVPTDCKVYCSRPLEDGERHECEALGDE